jgi:hypothetical protein
VAKMTETLPLGSKPSWIGYIIFIHSTRNT